MTRKKAEPGLHSRGGQHNEKSTDHQSGRADIDAPQYCHSRAREESVARVYERERVAHLAERNCGRVTQRPFSGRRRHRLEDEWL